MTMMWIMTMMYNEKTMIDNASILVVVCDHRLVTDLSYRPISAFSWTDQSQRFHHLVWLPFTGQQ